jgi:hypothetical protein
MRVSGMWFLEQRLIAVCSERPEKERRRLLRALVL